MKTEHTLTHPDAPCKNDFNNSAVTYTRCSLGGDTVCSPVEMGHAVSLQGVTEALLRQTQGSPRFARASPGHDKVYRASPWRDKV